VLLKHEKNQNRIWRLENREFPNIFIERHPICYRELDDLLWTCYWETGVMDFDLNVTSSRLFQVWEVLWPTL